jgi:hypothetical protein
MLDPIAYTITAVIFVVFATVTLVLSLLIIGIIKHHWHSQHRSNANLLVINTCSFLIYHGIALFMQIPLLLDRTVESIDVTWCQFRAYVYLSSCTGIMSSYLAQSISRYLLIVHNQRKSFSSLRFQLLMIVVNWSISIIGPSFLFLIPSAFQYEPESHLCLLTSKSFGTSFASMSIFFTIPATIIIILYISILLRTTRSRANQVSRSRVRRNLKVFQHILLHLGNMMACGSPFLGLVIINRFVEVLPIFYLIVILILSFGVTVETIMTVLIHPNIKDIVFARLFRNRVEILGVSTTNRTLQRPVNVGPV